VSSLDCLKPAGAHCYSFDIGLGIEIRNRGVEYPFGNARPALIKVLEIGKEMNFLKFGGVGS
jgi:hypothetical protein